MNKQKITLIRDNKSPNGFLSNNSISTDALNAINAIHGTENIEIIRESEKEVEISYEWTKSEMFLEIEEHLSKYGVCRKSTI